MDPTLLAGLVGLIYEAPLDDSWPTALAAIERALDSDHVVLMTHDTVHGVHSPVGSRPALEAQYCEQYAPLNTAWPVLMRHALHEPATDAMLLDREAHRSGIFFNEFLRPNGLLLMAGGVAHRSARITVGLSVSRSDEAREFQPPELALLGALLPHLGRAVRLRERLAACEQRAGTTAQLLDQISLATLLVDARGHPVQLNAAAEALLRAGDGLRLVSGRLVAEGSDAARLAAALAAATPPPPRQAAGRRVHPPPEPPRPGGMLRLERPSGRAPLLVDVLPLPGPPRWAPTQRPVCAVFVTDPDAAPRTAGQMLRQLFGLTAAEARVALALGSGEGLAGLSERLGTGVATTRTHLAAALGKTDLHRQAELVRLVERCALVSRREPA